MSSISGNDLSRPIILEGIVFDFDGTLAELHLDFGEMKRRLGGLAEEYLGIVRSSDSVPALEWLELLAHELNETKPESVEPFRARALALIIDMEVESAREGRLFPFTRSLLKALALARVRVGIITRNCELAVKHVFPDVERFCTGFLARDHVPRVKPDPDHLLRVLDRLEVAPKRALMVGDHPLDMQTGQRAGVLTAGVWSGRSTKEDLARSGAHWTAGNCEELVAKLRVQGWIRPI